MRKAILASVILGTMFSVAQAADVKLSGNFGYRHDRFDRGAIETERDRFRVQLKVRAAVNDKTNVVVGLTTGSTKSTWVDMGGENSLKNIDLDLAYVEYVAAPFAKVTLGKMYQPWHSSGLMFDQDIKPEGLAVALKHDSGLYGSVFKLKLSEEYVGPDSKLDGVQVGLKKEVLGADVNVGVALLDQSVELQTLGLCVVPLSAPTLPVCATADEIKLQVLNASVAKEVSGLPVTAFVQQVKNDKAKKLDTATAYGVTFGNAKKAGDWELSVMHQKSEANALSAIWTDSDFAGGAVAHDGTAIRGVYALADGWKVRGSYYDVEVGSVFKTDTKRLMLDLLYNF